MNRYLKLVQMEVHRFRYILAGLMAITAVCQVGGLFWTLMNQLTGDKGELLRQGTAHLNPYSSEGKLSFTWAIFNTKVLFVLPMLLSSAVIALYIFLIWYRDWFSRHSFVYRLLMLPTA